MRHFSDLLLLPFLFFGLLCSSASSFGQGPGGAWNYVRTITLSTPTTLANYQVKVSLTTGVMGSPYTNINANGSDLRFYDAGNNNCPYWIESFNNSGISVIWVKVASTATSSIKMYYGNSAAPAVSSGAATFDYFDDFTSSLGANWSTNASGGSVSQSGSNVTLSNTNAGTVSISSAFAPASTSFFLETKHYEGAYNRNRFYATTVLNGGSPTGFDYGYFTSVTGAQTASKIFYNGFTAATPLAKNTDYLTRWLITDGSTYNWSTL